MSYKFEITKLFITYAKKQHRLKDTTLFVGALFAIALNIHLAKLLLYQIQNI